MYVARSFLMNLMESCTTTWSNTLVLIAAKTTLSF